MSNMGLKTAIFNKNTIKYTKWPLLTAYNSWIWPHFLIKQNGILLRRKGSFRWPTSNSIKKIIEKAQNWKIQRQTPQGRTMHTLYPVNNLIKTTQESTLGLHFDSFKSQHQLLRNLTFYQLHYIWAPLYIGLEKKKKLMHCHSKSHMYTFPLPYWP